VLSLYTCELRLDTSKMQSIRFLNSGKSRKLNMDWTQAKKKYPKLSPYADSDRDGTVNKYDCKPFDASKDGIFSRALGALTGGRFGQSTAEYKAERTEREARLGKEAQKLAEKVPHYKYMSPKEKRKWRLKKGKKLHGEEQYKKSYVGRISRIPKSKTAKSQRSFMQLYKLVGPTARGYSVGGQGGKVKYKKTGRKAGRPRGTYKHLISGKGAVDIYTYRKWQSRQRALERLQGPGQQYSEHLPTSSVSTPPTQQQPLPLSQSYVPPSTNIFQERQGVESGNILHAPNVFRGELRNVGANTAVENVDKLNKPNANLGGDYYTDVDPMSGRPILKRRIRERWLTNE